MADITEILKKAEEVEVIGERGGRKLMSFDDQMSLATKENMEETMNAAMGKSTGDLGGIKWNPDGTLARTKGNTAAVNLERYYDNRFKKVKNKYYVVIDKRAIKGQATNNAPYPHIPAYIIASDQDGKVVCEKMVTISDKDFLADFTHKLDQSSMKLVLRAIEEIGVESETESLAF